MPAAGATDQEAIAALSSVIDSTDRNVAADFAADDEISIARAQIYIVQPQSCQRQYFAAYSGGTWQRARAA